MLKMMAAWLLSKITFLPRHAKIGLIGFTFMSLCFVVIFRVDKMNFKPQAVEVQGNRVYDLSSLQQQVRTDQGNMMADTVQKNSIKLSIEDFDKQSEETNEMEVETFANETSTQIYKEIVTEAKENYTMYEEQTRSLIQDKSIESKLHSSSTMNLSQFLQGVPPLRHYRETFVKRPNGKSKAVSYMKSLMINRTSITDASALHPLSKSEPYRSRVVDIQQKCTKYESSTYSHQIDVKRLVYDDKHKVVMCVVPKDACTTWKQIIWYMTGHSNLSEAFSPAAKNYLVLDHGKMKSMARLNSTEILRRLNTYTKFMVTRHPFRRLVSAYRDKFQSLSEFSPYRMRYGRAVAMQAIRQYIPNITSLYTRRGSKALALKRLQTHPGFETLSSDDKSRVHDLASRGYTGSITFNEFVRFAVIGRNPASSLDIHWRPQYMLCNPCAIDYDYVVRFDNIVGDSNRLLSYLQRDDPVEKRIFFPDNKTPAVNVDIAKMEFENIPSAYTSRLKRLYEPDFILFDHKFEIV